MTTYTVITHRPTSTTLSPEARHEFRPLELLADEELAIIGMLAGYAPLFRENVRQPLRTLGELAGLEENRRTSDRAEETAAAVASPVPPNERKHNDSPEAKST